MIGVSLLFGDPLRMGLVWTRETPLWTLPSRRKKVCVLCVCATNVSHLSLPQKNPVHCHYHTKNPVHCIPTGDLDRSLVVDYQQRLAQKRQEVAQLQRQKDDLLQMQERILTMQEEYLVSLN